jgi:FkbM family methyltransferase
MNPVAMHSEGKAVVTSSRMREGLGRLAMRYPRLLARARGLPLLGEWIGSLGRQILPPQSTVWAQVQAGAGKGLWLQLHPRTGDQYYRGLVEPAVQEFLAGHLEPGMVVYDVGANMGLYSLIAARSIGPAGRVFAFEFETAAAKRLESHAARNACSNISIIRAAVWSRSGQVHFHRADPVRSPDHGHGRVVGAAESETTPDAVPAVSLDDFAQQHPAPQLIKCDVEGGEAEVLRGAEELFSRHRPTLLCEVHDAANASFLQQWLRGKEYSLDWLEAGVLFPRHLVARPAAGLSPYGH